MVGFTEKKAFFGLRKRKMRRITLHDLCRLRAACLKVLRKIAKNATLL